MKTYRVNTIYPAFMGEVNKYGIGCPCTFLRLSGCNLRCYKSTKGTLCDTPEALDCKSGTEMTTSEIVNKLTHIGNKVICLTGGEPLLQDVTELLTALSNFDYEVVVETNGSKEIYPYRHIRNVSFVVDVKSPGSGESDKMVRDYDLLNEDDFVKFVVDTEEDYKHFKKWVYAHKGYTACRIAVGTFWGSEIGYQELLQKIQKDGITDVYLNMQTHKMACLYDNHKEDEGFGKLFIPKEL